MAWNSNPDWLQDYTSLGSFDEWDRVAREMMRREKKHLRDYNTGLYIPKYKEQTGARFKRTRDGNIVDLGHFADRPGFDYFSDSALNHWRYWVDKIKAAADAGEYLGENWEGLQDHIGNYNENAMTHDDFIQNRIDNLKSRGLKHYEGGGSLGSWNPHKGRWDQRRWADWLDQKLADGTLAKFGIQYDPLTGLVDDATYTDVDVDGTTWNWVDKKGSRQKLWEAIYADPDLNKDFMTNVGKGSQFDLDEFGKVTNLRPGRPGFSKELGDPWYTGRALQDWHDAGKSDWVGFGLKPSEVFEGDEGYDEYQQKMTGVTGWRDGNRVSDWLSDTFQTSPFGQDNEEEFEPIIDTPPEQDEEDDFDPEIGLPDDGDVGVDNNNNNNPADDTIDDVEERIRVFTPTHYRKKIKNPYG